MLDCSLEAPAEATAMSFIPAHLPGPCATMPVWVLFGCLGHGHDPTVDTSRDGDVQG